MGVARSKGSVREETASCARGTEAHGGGHYNVQTAGLPFSDAMATKQENLVASRPVRTSSARGQFLRRACTA